MTFVPILLMRFNWQDNQANLGLNPSAEYFETQQSRQRRRRQLLPARHGDVAKRSARVRKDSWGANQARSVHCKQQLRDMFHPPPAWWRKSCVKTEPFMGSGRGEYTSLKAGTPSSFDQNPSPWPVGISIHSSAKCPCQGGGLAAVADYYTPRVWHGAQYRVGIQ